MALCAGAADGSQMVIEARETVLACGGVGGLYEHSTNFPHLTGDGLAIAIKNGVELENIDYVQIHPTTLYSKNRETLLISGNQSEEKALSCMTPTIRGLWTNSCRGTCSRQPYINRWKRTEHHMCGCPWKNTGGGDQISFSEYL